MISVMSVPRRVVTQDRWEHQWLRALRWYSRALAASGRDTGKGSLDADDFSYALCESVWHLKDWLKNDPRQGVVGGAEIEAFANSNPALMVVADLANGTKHVLLSAKGSRTEDTRVSLFMWTGRGDSEDSDSIERVHVFADVPDQEEPRELIDIAWDGLAAWSRWLRSVGLQPPDTPEGLIAP